MILDIHSFPSPCKIIIHKCVGFLNNELRLLPLWSFSSLFNKMNFMNPPTQRYALLCLIYGIWDLLKRLATPCWNTYHMILMETRRTREENNNPPHLWWCTLSGHAWTMKTMSKWPIFSSQFSGIIHYILFHRVFTISLHDSMLVEILSSLLLLQQNLTI